MENGKGVVFDLDGVLVDTGEFHRLSWYDLAEKEGYHMSDEFFKHTFGMQNSQILPMLAKKELSPEEINRMSWDKEESYRHLIKGKLKLLPGVQELLDDLKNHGFKIAVGSSTPRENIDLMLEETQTLPYFDALIASGDVKNSKPAPDTFLAAAAKINLPPDRCVVVEDAIAGVQAGKAAGMHVIAVTTTRKREELQQADIIVDSMNELSSLTFADLIK
ncbi:MAG: HAD family phosphatase [Sedimentisphaerales bacterium]|nr:HAD family phosphatase [Sedimentisphaerales bacterium]